MKTIDTETEICRNLLKSQYSGLPNVSDDDDSSEHAECDPLTEVLQVGYLSFASFRGTRRSLSTGGLAASLGGTTLQVGLRLQGSHNVVYIVHAAAINCGLILGLGDPGRFLVLVFVFYREVRGLPLLACKISLVVNRVTHFVLASRAAGIANCASSGSSLGTKDSLKSESVEAERGVVGALVYLGARVQKEFLLLDD